MCGLDRRTTVHVYEAAPEGEVRFERGGGEYRRELRRCDVDGHVVSVHGMNLSGLYAGDYVDATYGPDGMRRTLERVLALPPERSDNAGRVERLQRYAVDLGVARPAVLDVGSGTGVFPNRLAALGWDVVALDPDERAVAHLREVAGVPAVHADFLTDDLDGLGHHDLVTFNKVLEHVLDPVAMLARARALLRPEGAVYAELPDGEAAAIEGFGREEFFIDHHHVFSVASAALLATAAGFEVQAIERLREPSSKYTLRLFLRTS
jgi:2-polyprenyl-3-methyl-5-hydroxy-6-metoxy-1,4-benzoquinol methylase